jgi:hypothetical protein
MGNWASEYSHVDIRELGKIQGVSWEFQAAQ